MSSAEVEVIRKCQRCSADLPTGALDCSHCHALVHEQQMERAAARARAFESNGALAEACEQWKTVLQLLPAQSKQAEWIRNHLRELGAAVPASAAPAANRKWPKWAAPLGPLVVLLAKGKTFLLLAFKLKFLLSFGASIAVYWAFYGKRFGIGLAVMILIHEMGHFIDIKRRGLPAEMPVFLPGFGAYVKWRAMGVSLATRAAVSLAGPLAGWLAAAGGALLWLQTGDGVWAALAQFGAWLNIMNLIPIWVLDGGHATFALSRMERLLLLAASLVLAIGLREWSLLLVGGGFLWRLFTKDEPQHGSPGVTAYFLAVLAALTFLMHVMPGPGVGLRGQY